MWNTGTGATQEEVNQAELERDGPFPEIKLSFISRAKAWELMWRRWWWWWWCVAVWPPSVMTEIIPIV